MNHIEQKLQKYGRVGVGVPLNIGGDNYLVHWLNGQHAKVVQHGIMVGATGEEVGHVRALHGWRKGRYEATLRLDDKWANVIRAELVSEDRAIEVLVKLAQSFL